MQKTTYYAVFLRRCTNGDYSKKIIQCDTIVFYHRLIKYLTNWKHADTDAKRIRTNDYQ